MDNAKYRKKFCHNPDESRLLPVENALVARFRKGNRRVSLSAELLESVRKYGISKPLIVTKNRGWYTVVDGLSRLEAARCVGLSHVPVRVIDQSRKG